LCVHIVIYILDTTVKGTAIHRGVGGAEKDRLESREGSVEAAGKEKLAMQGRISWGCREGSVGGAGKEQLGLQGRNCW
jgi:hypothetical protein